MRAQPEDQVDALAATADAERELRGSGRAVWHAGEYAFSPALPPASLVTVETVPPSARALLAGALSAVALAAATGVPWSEQGEARGQVAHVSVLEPWYRALDGSADAPATVVVMGDSVSEGYGAVADLERRWVGRLQDNLRATLPGSTCPVGSGGYEGTTSLVPAWYAAPSLPDPQIDGEHLLLDEVGPGGRAVLLGPGASITWRARAAEVAIGYRTGRVGGVLRVTVDGETALAGAAIETESEESTRQVWFSPTRDVEQRTYTVTNVSRKRYATVTDMTPYLGDRGRCVHVVDASHSGIAASTVSARPDYVRDSVSMNPDLLVLPLGFNDARAGRSPEQLQRSIARIIAIARSSGYRGPVLLVSWHTPPPGFFDTSWWDYRASLQELAGDRGVAYVDIGSDLPPVAGAPKGVYLDALHPGPKGQELIAAAMTRSLTRTGPVVPDAQ